MGKTAATQYWCVFAPSNANCSELAMNRLEASNGNAFSLPVLFFYNPTCLERPSKPSKATIYVDSSQFEWLQLRFLGSRKLAEI